MWCRGLVALAAAVSGGVAQQGVVSPAGYENRWAATVSDIGIRSFGTNNTRMLQIHTDVPPLSVSSVAWRPWRYYQSSATPGVTLECELFLGEGDYANRDPVFQANFVGGSTRVVARRIVSWPAWPPAVLPLPRDGFVLRLPLDRPWTFTGSRDLVWLLDVPASTGLAYEADTAWRLREELHPGIPHGTGCYNTWNNQVAVITAEAGVSRLTMQHRFSFSCIGLRPNSPTTTLLGSGSISVGYPFLCGYQYVDVVFLGLVSVASTTGTIPQQDFRVPYDAGFVGLRIHGQAFCLDDGRHPLLLPVTMTNGVEVELPETLPAWHPGYWSLGQSNDTRALSVSAETVIVTEFR